MLSLFAWPVGKLAATVTHEHASSGLSPGTNTANELRWLPLFFGTLQLPGPSRVRLSRQLCCGRRCEFVIPSKLIDPASAMTRP